MPHVPASSVIEVQRLQVFQVAFWFSCVFRLLHHMGHIEKQQSNVGQVDVGKSAFQ
jgi:hypothetical protein